MRRPPRKLYSIRTHKLFEIKLLTVYYFRTIVSCFYFKGSFRPVTDIVCLFDVVYTSNGHT